MMKPEYKERVLENFNAMAKQITYLEEVQNRKRPGTPAEINQSIQQLKRLLDASYNVVDVS